MLFDNAGTERHRGDRNGDTVRMIRIADGQSGYIGERRNNTKMKLLEWCRVRTRAMQKGDILAAGLAKCLDAKGDFFHVAHTGRQNDRAPLCSHMAKVGLGNAIRRGDLEGWYAQPVEHVDTFQIERR
ncbi:hypothetical protein LP421_16850 [Rhizobium sp. RCAM05350]|nr:hypothetical protein LP421_16850 [Rhizobium sp. RCAM05350]